MGLNAEEYVIALRQQVSGPAAVADSALVRHQKHVQDTQRALSALRPDVDAAAAKLAKLTAGTNGKVDSGAVRRATGMAEYVDQTKKAKEETGALEGKQAAFVAAGTNAAMMVAKAVAGIVLAVKAAAIAFVLFAVYVADAARSARLLNDAVAGSRAAGTELTAVIADVASKVPLARDRIAEMARALELAKFQGREMQLVLQTMGTIAAAVGDGAAGKIQQIAESSRAARRFLLGARDIYGEFASLAGTGLKSADVYGALAASMNISIAKAKALLLSGRVSLRQGIEALNAAVETRFGKTVAAQMLALSTQFIKAKENIAALFSGLNLEPLLRGLKSITDSLGQNTVTGRALKALFEKLLQPLIDASGTVFPVVRAFMQGILIGTLLVVYGFLLLKKTIVQAFGGDAKASIDWVKWALYAGVGVVGAFTAAVVVLTSALVLIAVVTAPVWLVMLLTVGLLIAAFVGFAYVVYKVLSVFDSFDLGESARNMVKSFTDALSIDTVVNAMMRLGTAAKDALKKALGISSPSRVAIEAARNVTTTFAGEIDSGTGQTQASFGAMVDPAKLGGGGSRGGGNTFGPFYYSGSREDFPDFEEQMRAMCERLLGQGPTPRGAT